MIPSSEDSPPELGAPEPEPAAPRPPAPRVWPALALLAGIFPAHALVGGVAAVVGVLLVTGGALPSGESAWTEALGELVRRPWGLLVLLLPAQALLVLGATLAAARSPRGLRPSLGLVRWRVSSLTVLCLLLATPCVSLAGMLVASRFGPQEGAHYELLEALLTGPTGAAFALMLALVTLGAGFAEELFFRGYVQTRLSERWSALPAIVVPALCFAAMHFEPAHAASVLPLGLWTGFLARSTASVLPAVGAHALNNLLGVGLTRAAGAVEAAEVGVSATELAVLAATALAGTYGLVRLRRELAACAR